MGEGWAVVAAAIGGGVVGILGPIAKAFVDDHLAHKRGDPLAEPRKKLLLDMLESGPDWRNLSILCDVIGASPGEVQKLLLQIGARGSERGNDMWALISRAPFPSN